MASKKDLVEKVGGYSRSEDGSYVVFDSRNPKYGSGYQDLGTSENANKAANVLNQLSKDSSIIKKDMGIWKSVTPGYAAHTYGQQSLQGLLDLKKMRNGSDVIVYDTEILGTAPMHRKSKSNLNFYSPTEIGFQHTKMINGELQLQNKSMSMLLRPNQEVFENLQGLINGVSNGNWTGMTDDVRRTLSDLTLYAGDPSQLFKVEQKDGRRIVSVNSQARDLHPLKGSVLTSSSNIALMRQGLDNLMKWGTKPEDAVLEMNSFMRNMQDVRFAGYNVYNFDQPMIMDYLNNQVGKNVQDSKVRSALDNLRNNLALNQIDGLHAVRTLYRDTYSRYGDATTLERMKKVFRIDNGGQSHHALSDVNVTVEQINRLLKDSDVAKVLTSGGKEGTNFGRFNTNPIKTGDHLFGVAGMTSRNAGQYDGVFRMKNNQLVSAYDMAPNPIYRNATYRVDKFYDGVNIDGKKMYGVQLYNESDDLYHTVFRETQADLQNAIHNHLQPIDKKASKYNTAARLQNEDRGLRRWRKMFSTENGGGVGLAKRMYNALDTARDIEQRNNKFLDVEHYMKKGMSQKEAEKRVKRNRQRIGSITQAAILKQNEWNTDEFVRDFNTIRGRLEGEEQWIRGFVKRLDNSKITGNSAYTRRVQDLAFSEFGKLLDNEFGVNQLERQLPNNLQALKLNSNGKEKFLTLTNAETVRGALYSHLYEGHVQRPNMGIIKKRYRDLLMQLKSYNALDAKKFEEMYKALDGVRHDSSLDNMLSDISNAVMKAREDNSLNGAVRHITVEDPTRVRGGKSGRLGQLTNQNVFNERFEALASTAINSVGPYQTFWNGKGDIQIQGREAQNLLASHDEAVKSILSRNGIGKDVAVSTANLKSSRSSLTKLAEAFVSQGMHVQLRFDGQRNGLKMVLADKNVSESVLNGSLPDLMKNNNVGVIDLPKINKDGSLTLGSQNRVARLKAQKVKNGYQFITGFDEILGTLASSAKTVRNMLDSASELGQRNGMLQANNYLASRSRRAMMNLSMNNRYGNPADAENMFQVRSKASNWIRGGAVDISDFAQEWYTNFYNNASPERRKLWKLKAPEKVLEQARQTGDIFANVMGVQARRSFQRQSDAFVNDKTGMNLGMHSIKDTHVSNYLRANRDARQLLPFGYFNPMARENIMKSVNYLALDENSVREKLASQGFSSQEIDRMVKRGIVTNQSLNVLEGNGDGKIAYLNMRAAYMDDSQLKSRAKELASTYEARALNESLPQEDRDKYKGFAERLRNAESISTYDGMFLMSQEAASAFETTREKRISLADGADLTDEIKAIIQRYSKGEVDFSKNITEEDFKSLPKLVQHLDPNVDTKQEWNTKKKVTVSQITTQDILRDAEDNLVFDKDGNPVMQSKTRADQVYDRWYASNTRIKGWNAEERALILEEQVTSTNTTKFITDAGGRQTATMLPGEVIRDLAGGEAHAIMPAFEAGKGMWGTELNKFISLAVDEAKAQVDKHGATTVGSLSKQEALEEINNIMQRSFNIKNKSLSRVVDGQIVVDELLGTGDDKSIDYTFKNVSRFMREVDEKLGLNISGKNYAFGNVGVGRQDIYDWENGIGLVDDHEKGLVKYGRKEVDMIAARAEQVLNTKDSALMGWLNNHMQYAARAQNEGIERIARGLIRTVSQESDYVPNKGDVVIRTTGAAFPGDDPLGRETGRVTKNGVREISMHAINDTPTITSKDTKLVADAYSGSIVDFGRSKGSFFDGVSFGSAIQQNGGTALLEMPDETFAKKYIRLVDFGDIAKGGPDDVPIIRDIQKTQQRIWRDIKEYQAVGSNGDLDLEKREERLGNIRDRINNSVQEYEDKAARMITNSRDSGLMKTMGAASMDMAGRFRIQGVNPFANYEQVDGKWQQSPTAKYEEGTVYMSRDRLKEMITDRQGRATHATRNMANAMGLDIKGLKGNEITELVLDNVNDKGLYGFVNRYPTIKQSTIQAMKVQIDDEMTKEGHRGARLTVGTATRLKADYDGDFLSTVLTHYSTSKEDATAIHGELSRLNEEERLAARSTGAEVLEDLHKEFTQTAKHLNVTVGELAKEVQEAAQIAPENRNKRQQGFMDIYNNAMKHTMSASDALETREARLGKEFVGFIDNTRDKVLNLATETVRVLQSSERISADDAKAYRNSIEDFTAAFSQDLISSKKFNVQNEIQRQMQLDSNIGETEAERRAREAIDNRYLKIQDMNEAIMNPTSENIELFKRHNEEIGLFDTSDPQEAKKMNRALDMIQDVAKFNGTSGGFNNTSLTMAVSEGKGADTVRQFLNGQGDAVVGTKAVRNIAEWADDETGQRLKQGINRWEKSVVQNFDSIESGDSLIDSISKSSFDSSDHVLNGATVAEEARVKLRDVVGKFTPKISGGIGGGVVAFGAMWAASALIRKAPTPEGLQEQTKEPAPAPAPKESMQTPTARITQNDGEYVNIRVSAKNAKNMSEEDIAALVHQEIGSMTSMKMDTTLNVNDNTQNIDHQWLQGVVANAIDKGFGF